LLPQQILFFIFIHLLFSNLRRNWGTILLQISGKYLEKAKKLYFQAVKARSFMPDLGFTGL